MKILGILPDHQTKVVLSDGREVSLSPLNKSQTREIVLENGQTVGIIQKLYISEIPQVVYLITEDHDGVIRFYLEFLDDPDDIWLEDSSETYMELLHNHQWVLVIPNGLEVFEKLVKICSLHHSLDNLLEGVKGKTQAGQTRGIEILKELVFLVENPELRDHPKYRNFWQDTCLILCKQLGIKT